MEIGGFENNLGLFISLIFKLVPIRKNHAMSTVGQVALGLCGQDSLAKWSNRLARPVYFFYIR